MRKLEELGYGFQISNPAQLIRGAPLWGAPQILFFTFFHLLI